MPALDERERRRCLVALDRKFHVRRGVFIGSSHGPEIADQEPPELRVGTFN
jgi:hypothetical protein